MWFTCKAWFWSCLLILHLISPSNLIVSHNCIPLYTLMISSVIATMLDCALLNRRLVYPVTQHFYLDVFKVLKSQQVQNWTTLVLLLHIPALVDKVPMGSPAPHLHSTSQERIKREWRVCCFILQDEICQCAPVTSVHFFWPEFCSTAMPSLMKCVSYCCVTNHWLTGLNQYLLLLLTNVRIRWTVYLVLVGLMQHLLSDTHGVGGSDLGWVPACTGGLVGLGSSQFFSTWSLTFWQASLGFTLKAWKESKKVGKRVRLLEAKAGNWHKITSRVSWSKQIMRPVKWGTKTPPFHERSCKRCRHWEGLGPLFVINLSHGGWGI